MFVGKIVLCINCITYFYYSYNETATVAKIEMYSSRILFVLQCVEKYKYYFFRQVIMYSADKLYYYLIVDSESILISTMCTYKNLHLFSNFELECLIKYLS